jgi:hypothetical protein
MTSPSETIVNMPVTEEFADSLSFMTMKTFYSQQQCRFELVSGTPPSFFNPNSSMMWFDREDYARFAYSFYEKLGRVCLLLDSAAKDETDGYYCIISEWKTFE